MTGLLVHGCYDLATLKTLRDLGVRDFAFDLRGRSPNLIPFGELKGLLSTLEEERAFLSFEDDRESTILSFLDLLKGMGVELVLIFRDKRGPAFYQGLGRPFYWMFDPRDSWEEILQLPNLAGLLLPLEWRSEYQNLPQLWEIVDRRGLDVLIHARNFSEAQKLENLREVRLSLDLTLEIEKGFRCVDQERLRNMSLWSLLR